MASIILSVRPEYVEVKGENRMTTEWQQPTKEEIEKLEAQQQAMEIFARIGGRTLGIKLEGDSR